MKKTIFIQYLKWFLFFLFVTFINGKTLFIHSHLGKDSFVIHSHPFDKSENTTHEHTTKELVAIELHTHGHSTDAIIANLEINSPLKYLAHQNHFYEDTIHFVQKFNSNLLRAPPFQFIA